MKIYSVMAGGLFELGDAWIKNYNGREYAIYVRGYGNTMGIPLGAYSEYARAKGVLFEIADAYKRKDDVFYMPEE